MSNKKKKIRFEKMLGKMFKSYSCKRAVKDIENNRKHKPKGQR